MTETKTDFRFATSSSCRVRDLTALLAALGGAH